MELSGAPLIWSADGATLVITDAKSRIIAVPVAFDGGFRQGQPRVLFALPPNHYLLPQTSDMKRFLVAEAEAQANPAPLRVLTAWTQRLEEN